MTQQQTLSPLEQAHQRDLESQARLEKIMRKPAPRPKKKGAQTPEASENTQETPPSPATDVAPKTKAEISAEQRWQSAKKFAIEKAIQAGEFA